MINGPTREKHNVGACEKVKYPTVSLDVAGLGLAGRVGVGCLSRWWLDIRLAALRVPS